VAAALVGQELLVELAALEDRAVFCFITNE
jgi:hypothetical protein